MIRVAAHAFMGSKVRGSLPPTLFAISQITNQSTVTRMPPKVGLLVSSGRSTAYAAGLRCRKIVGWAMPITCGS
jgi:hypothetical protein